MAPWFRSNDGSLATAPRVYCFSHAGGNSDNFLEWQPAIGPDVRIVAVTMPGRGHRFAESRPDSIDEYADAAAEAIARDVAASYVLFGHSLGALVAFEVARRLRADSRLRHLVASGAAAPALLPSQRVVRAAALEGREFAEAVGAFGGLPPEVVAAEELHDLLLPGVQADFRLVAGYRYRPAAALPFGVTLINGVDDSHVTEERLDRWADECRTPPPRIWVPGGHFYLRDDPEPVIEVLRRAAAVDEARTAGHSDLLI
ncbi:thioesterase II family protein [Micromonospora sp. LOL_024]|uniref:thioesterase II family protein n=1 Tax=Micromonospora sp. LOL_024 TaxID=3345412 RepID=UPI003A8A61D8